jgi:ribosomal protein L3
MIIREKSNHIRFEVTVIAINDNRVVVIRTKSNPSTNNCIVVNRSIRRATPHFVYNRESNNALN